jgi:hypothetical protein
MRASNSSLIETALRLCQYVGTLAVPASRQERWAAPLASMYGIYERILLTALLSALFAFFLPAGLLCSASAHAS